MILPVVLTERELPLSLTHIFTFHYVASFPHSHCYNTHTYCWIVSKTELTFPHLKGRFFQSWQISSHSTISHSVFSCALILLFYHHYPGATVNSKQSRYLLVSASPSVYLSVFLTAPPSWRQSNNVLLIDQREDRCSVEVNGCRREWWTLTQPWLLPRPLSLHL